MSWEFLAVDAARPEGGRTPLARSPMERVARAAQISRLVLLTQTAADFFEHRGYRVIERSSAPEQMQGSAEFRSLCPSSAACMAKSLRESA